MNIDKFPTGIMIPQNDGQTDRQTDSQKSLITIVRQCADAQ